MKKTKKKRRWQRKMAQKKKAQAKKKNAQSKLALARVLREVNNSSRSIGQLSYDVHAMPR